MKSLFMYCAAMRAYNICDTGWDINEPNNFTAGSCSIQNFQRTIQVPGSTVPARTLYDVLQALSYVASTRVDADKRRAWQGDIKKLMMNLE